MHDSGGEFDSKGGTWTDANARGNAVAGRFYGMRHADCTLPSDMVNCVFFPASGFRTNIGGMLHDQNFRMNLWCSTQADDVKGYSTFSVKARSVPFDGGDKAAGFNVRCVRDLP